MKRFILLLVLAILLANVASQAADWVPLADTKSVDQYLYDRSKLLIKDEEITYWKKVVFDVPQNVNGHEVLWILTHERIHCGEHTVKRLAQLHYSASGEPTEYVSQAEAKPEPVIPDSADDSSERVLCPQVWQHQEEARIKAEQKAASAELATEAKEMTTRAEMPEAKIHPAQPSKLADPATNPRADEQLY
jgi:hypothetical protein